MTAAAAAVAAAAAAAPVAAAVVAVAGAAAAAACWRRSLELLKFMLIQSCCPGCEDVLSEELLHTMLVFCL